MTYYTITNSPIGRLLLSSDGERLTGLHMMDGPHSSGIDRSWTRCDSAAPFEEARQQLTSYFRGELKDFALPMSLAGTEFQRRAWQELTRIPYGETISYSEQARRMGSPAASRAVGLANGRNPIAVIVPCHRVIGANGKLTGFGGG
ncbi:MAG TPA: methylated-DNA--[protein]-cysteine S-methyltransferase, partial [Chthonomonadales bacterium]|nr:methylated-DNA--[protein]-cysteine S-methyltransferase [Chthonomonadales bacterium]